MRRRPKQSRHCQKGGDACQQRRDAPVSGAREQPTIALVPFVTRRGVWVFQGNWFAYGGAATDATYLALAGTASNSSYSGLLLYTPLGAKPGSGPQEFIAYSAVPEPGSLTLLGTGLIGLDRKTAV